MAQIEFLDAGVARKTSGVKDENGRLRSLGADPQIIFKPAEALPVGWYRIDLDMGVAGAAHPQVYFDFGDGFSETYSARLRPKARNGGYFGIVSLPFPALVVRLDPTETTADFTISSFRFRSQPLHERMSVLARQGLRVMRRHPGALLRHLPFYLKALRQPLFIQMRESPNFRRVAPAAGVTAPEGIAPEGKDGPGAAAADHDDTALAEVSPPAPKRGMLEKAISAIVRRRLVPAGRRILTSGAVRHWPLNLIVRELEVRLVKGRGKWLFDEEYYAEAHPEAAAGGRDLIRHYITEGEKAGNFPNRYFDPFYYAHRNMQGGRLGISALAHFLVVGRSERLNPSPWFDYRWYLTKNTDVAIASADPYRHFLEHGLKENRSASSAFDPAVYLNLHPEARSSQIPALEHFLIHNEGDYTPLPVVEASRSVTAPAFQHHPDLPPDIEAAIFELPSVKPENPVLDVVVPVYRARDETLSCLWHVLKSRNETPFELVVVDDCSPEPDLSAALARLAEAGYIRLLVNEENAGFVKSVNRGMRCNTDRDVILLNSDTEVFGNWIDRLRNAALADPVCATVTPLTNSGTICSYPHTVEDNAAPLELSYEELDGLAHELNAGQVVAAPTAVGFCMYIKRSVLWQVGYFDEEAFGLGYGEENDFCLRCQKAGYVDLILADTFVRHLGSMSFQGKKAAQVANALKIIAKRYPSYNEDVRKYIRRDPLRPFRAKLDAARLRRFGKAENVLIISHVRGGGTEQHVQEEIARILESGMGVYRMQADLTLPGHVVHFHPHAPDVPNLPSLSLDSNVEEIVDLWRELGISEVHVHHLADFGARQAERIRALLLKSGLSWRVTVHDYLSICPRINLVDENGQYCGEPDESGCAKCLRLRRSAYGAVDIAKWRAQYGAFLSGASRVVVPNEDVSARLGRYFADLHLEVRPHEQVVPAPLVQRTRRPGDRLRIGTIGAISKIKGFDILVACSEDARRRNLPLDFVVVGYTEDDARAQRAGIEITGPYVNSEALERIKDAELDAVFLASTWPETYSYTLSIALRVGIPIIAFDIGAIGERLRGTSGNLLLPLDMLSRREHITTTIGKFLCN